MTIITFQSRIHFASHVLEEALRAELEERAFRSVLVVSDAVPKSAAIGEHVMIGLPPQVAVLHLQIGEEADKSGTRRALSSLLSEESVDAVIAYGSAKAIRHGRICRQDIGKLRYQTQQKRARTRARERDFLPWFCVVPSVDGLPDPCLDTATAAGYKTEPPSVIICDPALIAEAHETDEARAYATTLGRCLAALGCETFNPMADGLAVEGLRRLQLFEQMDEGDRLGRSRELMAAMLNGAIAQQKGPGAIQVLAHALYKVTGRETDHGELQRILLPGFMRAREVLPEHEARRVARIMDVANPSELPDAIQRLLDPLPLARALRELKMTREEISAAVEETQKGGGLIRPLGEQVQALLDQAY